MQALRDTSLAAPSRKGLAEAFRAHPHPGGIIVHPERRFIYMKPTKTAGTSILRKVLEPKLGGFIHHKDHPEAFADWLANISDEELTSYYIFSVVRDPWDRFQSMAAHLKIHVQDLVENFDEVTAKEPAFSHTLPLILYTHLDGEPFVDALCRFEHLAGDMAALFKTIGLPKTELPHANKSNRKKFANALTAAQIDWVANHYSRDVAAYGYAAPKISA